MAHLKLDKALAEISGVRRDGSSFLLSEDVDLTFYASVGEEALQISRISRVDPSPELVIITTHKGEKFFIPPERLIAMKLGAPTKQTAGSAGFRA